MIYYIKSKKEIQKRFWILPIYELWVTPRAEQEIRFWLSAQSGRIFFWRDPIKHLDNLGKCNLCRIPFWINFFDFLQIWEIFIFAKNKVQLFHTKEVDNNKDNNDKEDIDKDNKD